MSANLDPENMKLVEDIKRALLELQTHAASHPMSDAKGLSIEAFVAAGAFSAQTAAFIANHQVRFYGFTQSPIGSDIPVLDVVMADRTSPLTLIGFRDGHVEIRGLNGSRE